MGSRQVEGNDVDVTDGRFLEGRGVSDTNHDSIGIIENALEAWKTLAAHGKLGWHGWLPWEFRCPMSLAVPDTTGAGLTISCLSLNMQLFLAIWIIASMCLASVLIPTPAQLP